MFESKLEQNTDRVISGYINTTDVSKRYVELYFGNRFLRRIPAHLDRKMAIVDSNIMGFWFAIHPSLVKMLPIGTILKVKDAFGKELPHTRNAKITPIGSAIDGGENLLSALNQGHLIDKWGALKIPFSAQVDKRKRYAKEMNSVITFFNKRDIIAFPHYGTLLGLIREGKFIDHDDDVDLSIAIYDKNLKSVVNSYYDIVEQLIEEGHRVDLIETGQIQFRQKGSDGPLLDIFLTWGINRLEFNSYFGVVGSLSKPLDFVEAELEGYKVKIPSLATEVIELTFGPNWKTPDPSFVWQPPARVKEIMEEIKNEGRPRLNALMKRQSD